MHVKAMINILWLRFARKTTAITNQSNEQFKISACIVALLLLIMSPAHATYEDDINFTMLISELGAGTPDGTGVFVSQVEASATVGNDLAWMPDPGNIEFNGKTIVDLSGAVPNVYSGHATGVGRNFYGNITSTSPGITDIASYSSSHWLGGGYLRIYTGTGLVYQPLPSASRIVNHSWIGNAGGYNTDGLARLDWTIDTDETIQVVGFVGSASNALLSSAYNVISVNNTAAPTNSGSANAGGIYTSGRTKPEIVAPANTTSNATPRVASVAALLIEAANNNPSWSTDPTSTSTTNRNGNTIYNAERVEIVKAALMAGADRETSNSTSTDISDYRVNVADQTTNGLDRRFGAGQLNSYNSYQIIAAGEQNSDEDLAGGAGMASATGFDYDPAFGGSNGSNTTATYYFAPTGGPARLTTTLAWNLAINGGSSFNFNGSATLYDLDLRLFDVTNSGNWVLVASSQSSTENTENIWQLLDGNKNYALQVSRGTTQGAFRWDYGLAWKIVTVAPLSVDPIALPSAILNQTYPQQSLAASNGQSPYTWSIISGSLPSGLTLNSNGAISGSASTLGQAIFTVQVTDANFTTATLDLQINVTSTAGGNLFPGYFGPCGACHSASAF